MKLYFTTILIACILSLFVQSSLACDRNWKVYLVPFSHTDVGYTDTVENIIEKHNNYLDSVLVYIDRSKNLPEGQLFKWRDNAASAQDCSAALKENIPKCGNPQNFSLRSLEMINNLR